MEQEGDDGLIHVQHSLATARVPEGVGIGVFANEIVMLKGSGITAIDFIQGMANPRRLMSRVIINDEAAANLARTLEQSMSNCTVVMNGCSFVLTGGGSIRWISEKDSPERQSEESVAQIYESTKISDEALSGKYANMANVYHSGGDFCIDFLLTLFPRSVVTSRVFLSMSHAGELLEALKKLGNSPS